jgi:UDP-N-acetylglucosamine diphosphorylase/glucosamine-1-phosphate N-acetyltransferase
MPLIYIFEDSQVDRLYPLTYSRAAFELRCGAGTLLDRMRRAIPRPIAGVLVRDALAGVLRQRLTLPVNPPFTFTDGVILINARWLMNAPWVEPQPDSAGLIGGTIVWIHLSPQTAAQIDLGALQNPRTLEAVLPAMQRVTATATMIARPWDLLENQRDAFLADWPQFGPAQHGTLLGTVHQLEQTNIHIAPGVKIYPGVVLDAQLGPIVIDAGVEIRANAVINGPVYIGPRCVIRTAADIREDNHLGPNTRIGGEVIGSITHGNCNKQHHGFLGQSILGEWVNLGAGTTTSNLKNTYGTIRMPLNGTEENTGRQFLGSVIGDHAKIGIGSYLPTGSVIGFAAQMFVPRPPKFVPSFSWLVDQGFSRLDFEKAQAIATTVMHRRGLPFTPADHELWVHIAAEWSTYEKFDWPT